MKRYQRLLTIGIAVIAVIAVFKIPPFLQKRQVLNETRKYISEKYSDTKVKLSAVQLLSYSRVSVSKTDVFEVRVRPLSLDPNYLVIADMKKSGAVFYDSKQMPMVEDAVKKAFEQLFVVWGDDMNITIRGFRDTIEYPKGLTHPKGGAEYDPRLLNGYFIGNSDVFEFLGGEQAYVWISADTPTNITEKDIEAMNGIGRKLFASGSQGHIALYCNDKSYSLSDRSDGNIRTYYYDYNSMSEGKEGALKP